MALCLPARPAHLGRSTILLVLACAVSVLAVSTATSAQAPPAAQEEATITVTEPVFVALRVRDVEAATDWYQRVFGLDVKKTLDGEDNAFSIRIVGNDTVTVELIEQRGTEEPPGRHHGLFKAGFYVDDAARALERLRASGAVAPDEQVTVFVDEPLAVRTFVIQDPDGNRLQFFERCDDIC